ncbi:MAG: hypothetical protein FWC70_12685 [Defluviitaleaceae bacterium]|nr:hypothetical protein [Defluviitaleaceae bacterium]
MKSKKFISRTVACVFYLATVALLSACACGSGFDLVGRWYEGAGHIEFFDDGTATTTLTLGFRELGFGTPQHLVWSAENERLTFTYHSVRIRDYAIERSVLTLREPGRTHGGEMYARRDDGDGIVGVWQQFVFAPGGIRNMQRGSYLEFFADNTGRFAENQTFTHFTWFAENGVLTKVLSPSIEQRFVLEESELILASGGVVLNTLTRGTPTPEEFRIRPESLPIEVIAPQSTPAPPTPEPVRTPASTPPPVILLSPGRWNSAQGEELRIFEGGRGFLFGRGENYVFMLTQSDDALIYEIEADGSVWRLSYNSPTLFLETGARNVLFEPSENQLLPSARTDAWLHGRWLGAFGRADIALEFRPNNTGRWTENSLPAQEFEWIFNDDVLFVWGMTRPDGTPRNEFIFDPVAGLGEFLVNSATEIEVLERIGAPQSGLFGSWQSNQTERYFRPGTGSGDLGFGEEVTFTWTVFDDVLVKNVQLDGEIVPRLYRFNAAADTLTLQPLSFLLMRDV